MTDFMTLPPGPVTLGDVQVPGWLMGQAADLVTTDLGIEAGRITAPGAGVRVAMGGAIVLPAFVDMHTHLDKGHIWPRAANPDGTFMGALTTVAEDRAAHWTADDLRARMEFALRGAWAHGTRAIRTHIDSLAPQDRISWPVLAELRADWAGRIAIQGACLAALDRIDLGGGFRDTADLVAASGGILGAVTYPMAGFAAQIRAFLRLAEEWGLAVDFHVDENGDPGPGTLSEIARAVIDTGFAAPVTVGHCCSLAVQPEAEADRTLDLVAEAGLNVVSLPMCNMYLQDRQAGRTPRWRGVTLVHEMKARGINVSFASDNTRDPFYAYGDLDMIEVLREATRIAHLDHSDADWSAAFSRNPARACGFDAPDLAPGAPADLVIFNARRWTELLARPQSDRIVLRAGCAIDRTLPDFRELDHLMRIA